MKGVCPAAERSSSGKAMIFRGFAMGQGACDGALAVHDTARRDSLQITR
jgi:hypothetical protein